MLAYGQTGAGKTFTMGTEETKESVHKESRGIIPRITSRLFEVGLECLNHNRERKSYERYYEFG